MPTDQLTRPAAPTDQLTRPAAPTRDRYVDGLRALSLFVVVAWHWVFTVISWHHGPHAGNPIGSAPGLWALTWALQVMPLFFFVGGFAHLRTWESVERAGEGYATFCRRRLGRLLKPAALCVAAVACARVAAGAMFPHVAWLGSALMLTLSPLWFLCVYVVLVCIAPAAIALHRRFGALVPVVLGGAACLVDVARFHAHIGAIAWLNFLFVWAFAHQLGFFYERLTSTSRRAAVAMGASGLLALLALTNIGLYPRSMVGVPGDRFSNMGPPTLCIVALCLLQVGLVALVRPAVTRWLGRSGAQRAVDWATRRSMTVYLWHFVGFSLAYGVLWGIGVRAPQSPGALWWAERPLFVIAPAVMTFPLVRAFSRFDAPRRAAAV
ncbi:MAG TPA: acyltransferase [Acidimicrobiales bacterium]|nr:acyltransferase [Acidimicrobiales bacterium]